MTVAALPSKVDYLENGVTTSFAVPFRFLAGVVTASRVLADGTVVTLAEGVDFTVTGGETDAGGTLALTGASISGATLRIRRVTPRAQVAVYNENDRFPAESHEQALDRQMMVDQEQDDKIADTSARALMVPDGEIAPVLPPRSSLLGQYLAIDAAGNVIGASGSGADGALRADLAQPTGPQIIGFSQDAAGGAGTLAEKLKQIVAVTDEPFGADATGLAVATSAFSDAASASSIVRVPSGLYDIGAVAIDRPTFWDMGEVTYPDGASPLDLPGLHQQFFGGYLLLRRTQTTLDDYTNIHVQRLANYTGGTTGTVGFAHIVETIVSDTAHQNEWASLNRIDNYGTGENAAEYNQAVARSGAGPTWAGTDELSDWSIEPTAGRVGREIGIFANGNDPNNGRVVVDAVIRKRVTGAGGAEAAFGVRLNSDPAAGNRVKRAFSVTNLDFDSAFDTTGATQAANGAAVRLAATQTVAFEATNERWVRWKANFLEYGIGPASAPISIPFSISDFDLVYNKRLRIDMSTPASSGASGAAGEIRFDASYVYFCVAADTWKRAALASY